MKSLLELKNSCRGQSAIFIGLGCSINQFDLSKIDREKYKLISMNFWYPYGPQKFGIDVDYYVVGDYINVFTKNYLDSWKRDNLKEFKGIIDKTQFCAEKLKNYVNSSPMKWISNNKSYLNSTIILIKPEIEYLKKISKKETHPGKVKKTLKRIDTLRKLNSIIQQNSLFKKIYLASCQSYSRDIIYEIENNKVIFNNKYNSGFSAYILPLVQFLGFKDLTIMGVDTSKAGHFFFDLTELYQKTQPKLEMIQRFGYENLVDDLNTIKSILEYSIIEVNPKEYLYYFNPQIFPYINFEDLCENKL